MKKEDILLLHISNKKAFLLEIRRERKALERKKLFHISRSEHKKNIENTFFYLNDHFERHTYTNKEVIYVKKEKIFFYMIDKEINYFNLKNFFQNVFEAYGAKTYPFLLFKLF